MAPAGGQRSRREARRKDAGAEDDGDATRCGAVAAPAASLSVSGTAFAKRCRAARMVYSAMGKAEWWWIMDDVEEMIAKQLLTEDYAVIDNMLLPEQAAALQKEVEAAHRDGKLEQAGLVNGRLTAPEQAKYTEQATRGDVIAWVDSDTKEWPYGRQLEAYLTKLGTLIAELGGDERKLVPELGRVTSRSKAMIACYPGGGARYIKHVDNDGKHELCRTRVLTALMYLNDSWEPGDGGELAIFSGEDDTKQKALVEPLNNRLLIFWSDWRVPHEVRPAKKPRYAVTLWLLDNTCNGLLPGKSVGVKTTSLQRLREGGTDSEGATDEAATEEGSPCGALAEGAPQGPEAEEERRPNGADRLAEEVTGEQAACPCDGSSSSSAPAELRYEWQRAEGGDEGDWELKVELLGEAAGCPAVDLSEAQLRLSAADDARPLLCVPLPFPGAEPSAAPRWSKRRAALVLRFGQPAAPPAAPPRSASEKLAAQLSARGWGFVDAFLSGPEADALRSYVLGLRDAGRLRVGMNRHEGASASKAMKNDEYTFLEDTSGPEAAAMRTLSWRCNELVAGLARGGSSSSVAELQGANLVQGKPMVAVYPGNGARYGRHFDATAGGLGDNGRVLTVLAYLNPFWKPKDGGALRLLESLHDEAGVADVDPLHGRVAAFLCGDRWPHEVLPAWADRVAVTLWYYDGRRLRDRCAGSDIDGFGFEGG